MAKRSRGFGRELEAIIHPDIAEPLPLDTLESIPISAIRPNPLQPRTTFDPRALEDLTHSIRSQGIVQPIVVRPREGNRYELIAGERRLRATSAAGLREIPAVVRDIDDHTALTLALVENLQREDLNPIDEARALKRLVEEFGLSHQETADVVGRSRMAVSNLIRLLDLHPEVQSFVMDESLDMGHARALLSLEASDQLAFAERVAEQRLSVRQTEKLVRSAGRVGTKLQSSDPPPSVPDIPDHWRLRVSISQSKKHGTELRFRLLTEEELHAIFHWLAERDT